MCSTPYLPPGFRFHPTDEELIVFYMKKKVSTPSSPHVSIIADIDLYKFNPWELPAKASFGDSEWFFFTPRDRKYPNGARPNRTAGCGYWKATGTDKPILNSGGLQCIGVKKALVFYKGRPPKGIKTDWVMHEYRLLDDNNSVPRIRGSMRLDDWVLCRVREKNNIPKQKGETSEDQSTFSYNIPQFNTSFSCRNTQILKMNNSSAFPNKIRAYSPDASKKIGGMDEQINNYYFNMGGFSNPSPKTDTSSYSCDKTSSPLEDVFKSLKRTHSVVSFGEESPCSLSKKIHALPQENMEDSSIFQICYLTNFTFPDIYFDPSL